MTAEVAPVVTHAGGAAAGGIPLMPRTGPAPRANWQVPDPVAVLVVHADGDSCDACQTYLGHLPGAADPNFTRVHEQGREARAPRAD